MRIFFRVALACLLAFSLNAHATQAADQKRRGTSFKHDYSAFYTVQRVSVKTGCFPERLEAILAHIAKQVGQKRAREVFFLEQTYSADEAFQMGMVNRSVPHAELEKVAFDWAKIINSKSPTAIRMLKFAFNLTEDGMVGQQIFAGEATRLAYMTDEAKEGRDAFLEKRPPNFDDFPRFA